MPNTPTQFVAGALWPDNHGAHINAHGGGVLSHAGRYYWYGEHKIAGQAGNLAHVGVHCDSSADLYNWTDEGIALAVSDDPASDIARGCILEPRGRFALSIPFVPMPVTGRATSRPRNEPRSPTSHLWSRCAPKLPDPGPRFCHWPGVARHDAVCR